MNNMLVRSGLAVLVCAAVSAPAFSAGAEEISAGQELSAVAGAAAEKVPSSPRPSPAFFMNEEACASLDWFFLVQPSRESAVKMFRPCVQAISKTYGVTLKMWDTPEGIAIFHSEKPGARLPALLAAELKKRRNQVFGHPVLIISNAAKERKTTFQCEVSRDKFIQFLPDYGEVHYVKADGSKWKDHEDGMRFDLKFLESYPPKTQYTITDDEGEVIGGWTVASGDATWEAEYRGKTYRNCKTK